jgi:hypothetical protein
MPPLGLIFGPTRPEFQPGDLVAKRGVCSPQFGHRLKQLDHQALQVSVRQNL